MLIGRAACLILAVTLLACVSVARATAQEPAALPHGNKEALLDVPFLAQTELLCGGAALAMVLRYWGESGALAEDFASLVDVREGGIRTSALVEAATTRGWTAIPQAGRSIEWLRAEVQAARPPIALIEDRPGVFHYVVVVAVTDAVVVLHDPARAPYRVVPRRTFEMAWDGGQRWALVVTSAPGRPVVRAAAERREPAQASPSTIPSTCDGLVMASVSLARAGDLAAAEPGLFAAMAVCPGSPAGWRELAGVRFLQGRYAEAGVLAGDAIKRSPHDEHALEILATTRFLGDDLVGALDAWNRLGRPMTDVVSVEGAERTPHPTIIRATGLSPRRLLTAGSFARAARRLGDLPVLSAGALRYRPLPDGVASVSMAVTEWPAVPRGLIGWGTIGATAAFLREIKLGLAGLADQAERVELSYRGRHNRPAARIGISAPAPGKWPLLLEAETFWERQAYVQSGGSDPLFREVRRRTGLRVSDWATGGLRWQAGAALDRFEESRYVALATRVNTRWFNDRMDMAAGWEHWSPLAAGTAFSARELTASWRTRRDPNRGATLTGQAGLLSVGESAPLALWPVASSSSSRGVLLRVRPLFDDGAVIGSVMGQRMAFATTEYVRPVVVRAGATIGFAAFVDAARAWQVRTATAVLPGLQVGTGVGLRLKVPGAAGQVRFDVASGFDRWRPRLSAGYVRPWGHRR